MFFTTKLFPELKGFPDRRRRREAFQRAHQGLLRSPSFWLVTFTGLALLMSVAGLPVLAPRLRGVLEPVFFACGSGILAWGTLLFRGSIRRSLRVQLRERGELICIACGYDLVGTASSRCPECGAPINKIG